MKVDCENGFYKFFTDNVGELRIWEDYNGIKLTRCGDFFTFEALAAMPNYSFTGAKLGEESLIVNYAGDKAQVLKLNNLVYDYTTNKIVNKLKVLTGVYVDNDLFINTPILPQAGGKNGFKTLTGFSGFWNANYNMYKIESLKYENISSPD